MDSGFYSGPLPLHRDALACCKRQAKGVFKTTGSEQWARSDVPVALSTATLVLFAPLKTPLVGKWEATQDDRPLPQQDAFPINKPQTPGVLWDGTSPFLPPLGGGKPFHDGGLCSPGR